VTYGLSETRGGEFARHKGGSCRRVRRLTLAIRPNAVSWEGKGSASVCTYYRQDGPKSASFAIRRLAVTLATRVA